MLTLCETEHKNDLILSVDRTINEKKFKYKLLKILLLFLSEIMVPAHMASSGARDSKSGGSGSRSGTSALSGERMQSPGVRFHYFASSQVSTTLMNNLIEPQLKYCRYCLM
jgi:hypothetical protein